MPRMTAKYTAALRTARQNNIVTSGSQEHLYDRLFSEGYFWNSKAKVWEYHPLEEADPPTPMVMIRVWADIERVQSDANRIIENMSDMDLDLIEKSKLYPCRPPKQKEGRVYLRFVRKDH